MRLLRSPKPPIVLVTALAWALIGAAGPAQAAARGHEYVPAGIVPISAPGDALYGDILAADDRTGIVYFSDDANSTLDVVDGRHSRLLKQVAGFPGGPAGIVVDRQEQVWVGSNDGTVQIVQAEAPFAKLGAVHIGANSDELAYDPEHKIILATSPDAATGSTPTPFVTLIDARPSSHHAILAKIRIPQAGSGSLEQPAWDAESGMFVESVRHTTGAPNGAVLAIDPVTRKLARVMPIHSACSPNGLAAGPDGQALIGCGNGGPILMDVGTGDVVQRFTLRGHCCSDEVWYSRGTGQYYAAEAGALGPPPDPQLAPPSVVVVDARSLRVTDAFDLGSSGLGFHTLTALARPDRIFVPESDGIHVFARAAES
jgi:DNA-binding beta-propeller fold protein YncE